MRHKGLLIQVLNWYKMKKLTLKIWTKFDNKQSENCFSISIKQFNYGAR